MAGTITVSTISDGTNSTSSTNCIQGSAKAWVNFNATGPAIRGSYNVSSVTTSGTGLFQVNFTNALSNANYSMTGSGSSDASTQYIIFVDGSTAAMTTTYVKVATCNPNVGNINHIVNCVTITGN